MSEQIRVALPSEKEYVSAIENITSADQLYTKDALERVIKREAFRSKGFELGMRNARYWGGLVEPQDRSFKGAVHTSQPVTEAIRLGSGFGFALLPQVHRGFVTYEDAIASIPGIDQPDASDLYQARHEIADQIVGLGQEGVELMGPEANDMLMDLEMKMVHEAEHQRMFRIGCGIVALGGFIAHERRLRELDDRTARQARQEFEKSLESVHDMDWDSELAKLLGGDQ